jgi:hypothetical protein
MKQLAFLQNSFAGGLNQQVDGSRLAANEYTLLTNGRVRFNVVEAVKQPLDITPEGVALIQGVYAAGSYSIVFADGKAYFRNESVSGSAFTQIAGFQMSTDATALYAVAVPASTINFVRKTSVTATSVNAQVLFTTPVAASPQALLVQDGVNQPWVIFPDGTARVTNNYNQWTTTEREYVPIGRQMLWHEGILYIVSGDGLSVFRSLSGRPLDFMVVIDSAGNKLPDETDGGALAISHKVDYAPITCIASINSPDGSFFVSTARTSYAVRPNYDFLVYGEPTFDNVFLFSTGAAGQFAFVDILGDAALIDYSGIRSFNAVQQFRIEGKNSPFSAKIDKLLAATPQIAPAAVTFDNYGLFAVTTVFGRAIAVYDTLSQQWVSLDLLSNLADTAIIMFAEVKTNLTRKLLCCTASSVFELYSESQTLTEIPGFLTQEFNSGDPAMSQKATHLQLTFLDVLGPGTVSVKCVEDGKLGTTRTSRLIAPRETAATTGIPPVLRGSVDKVRTLTVPVLDIAKTCWKFASYIRWTFPGKLAAVKLLSNADTAQVSIEEQSAASARLHVLAIAVGSLEAGAQVVLFGGGFESDDLTLKLAGSELTLTVLSDSIATFNLPDGWQHGLPPLYFQLDSVNESYVWSGFNGVQPLVPDNDSVAMIPAASVQWINPDGTAKSPADVASTVFASLNNVESVLDEQSDFGLCLITIQPTNSYSIYLPDGELYPYNITNITAQVNAVLPAASQYVYAAFSWSSLPGGGIRVFNVVTLDTRRRLGYNIASANIDLSCGDTVKFKFDGYTICFVLPCA